MEFDINEIALAAARDLKDRWEIGESHTFRGEVDFEGASDEEIADRLKPFLLDTLYTDPEHREVTVHAKCLVEHPEDDVEGSWTVKIMPGNKFEDFASIALDVFHDNVTIGNLDEYEFYVTCDGVRLSEKEDAEGYDLISEGILLGLEEGE